MNNTEENLRTAESLIVGNELESEDIQLITSNKTTAFQENVDISVTDEGKAQVKKGKDGFFKRAFNKIKKFEEYNGN